MSERTKVALTTAEIAAVLADASKLQLATLNSDGTPHLVTMFYGLHEGRIAFWTYRASRKARNLARDPRLTCLVEDGESYFELRGVQITGTATPIEDPAGVATIGRLIAARLVLGSTTSTTSTPDMSGVDVVESYVEQAARKRIAYLVEPSRVASWDHRKLLT